MDRLAAVKEVIDEFVTTRSKDRIGLVIFGAEAFTQVPLTLDHDLLRALLQQARTGMAVMPLLSEMPLRPRPNG